VSEGQGVKVPTP